MLRAAYLRHCARLDHTAGNDGDESGHVDSFFFLYPDKNKLILFSSYNKITINANGAISALNA